MERNDISVCHRLRGNGKRPRPTIVKFVKRKTKSNIMKAKKNLKDKSQYKNVYINDDLSILRGKVVKMMKDDKSIQKVWTIDGKILCILEKEDGSLVKVTLDSIDDIPKLGWDAEREPDLRLYFAL